jgi:ribonuclease PH
MNVAMDDENNFIEIQGTSEKRPFTYEELESMLGLAKKGITELFKYQNDALRK